jgi:predicted enzyme related to lactoylglutathione lyase
VLAEPFDVLDAGRMAFAGDPTGGVFGVWQARAHKGAQLVNEPGTWNWSELATRDVATARAFYSAVFGWASEELTDVPGGYHVQTIDDHQVAGILPISPEMGNMPTGWGVYFSVEDGTPRQQGRRSSAARSSPSRSTSPSAGQHGSSTRWERRSS